MKRTLWKASFSDKFVPKFPCPTCSSGHLILKKNTLQEARPGYVTFVMYEEDPTGSPERFIMFLECVNSACAEMVSVAGEVSTVPEEDNEGHQEWVGYLQPLFMHPPPPIISVPDRVPKAVRKEIVVAFQLFWADYRVCASRLRTSLERLMDHFGVAKTRIQKDPRNANKPGKRKILDLSARIDKLPKKIGTHDFSEILHALRVIGNLGTHGANVTHAAILDAFRLYEKTLDRLFEDENDSATAIIKRLKFLK